MTTPAADGSEPVAETRLRAGLYSGLGIAGTLLMIAGLLALSAANKETPVLGAGMLPCGAFLLLAKAGGRRGWRGFPWAPLLAAALIGAMTGVAFQRHMKGFVANQAARSAATTTAP